MVDTLRHTRLKTPTVGVERRLGDTRLGCRPLTADSKLPGPVYARDLPSGFVSKSFNRSTPWL